MKLTDNTIRDKITNYEQDQQATGWDAESNWKNFTKNKRRRTIPFKVWIIAGSVAASLLIYILIDLELVQRKKVEDFQFSTTTKVESRKINEDLTVSLNKNSGFRLRGNQIEISGEAYLQIRGEKEYQIWVAKLVFSSQQAEINVNMASSAQEIKVSVTRGKVLLHQENGSSQLINQNYDCQINPQYDVYMVSVIESQNYLAWRTGKLEFDDVPLATVAAELSRYYGKQIECSDKNSADHYVSIRFDGNTLPEALQRLETQNGVLATRHEDVYIINKTDIKL